LQAGLAAEKIREKDIPYFIEHNFRVGEILKKAASGCEQIEGLVPSMKCEFVVDDARERLSQKLGEKIKS